VRDLLAIKHANAVATDTNGGPGIHLIHGQITDAILGAAYRVHSRLGPGLLERPYKVCLCHELERQAVPFAAEKLLPVEYDGLRVDLGYRIDLIVADAVIVEVKAVESILPIHEAQLLSYLRLSGKRVGLLINFNVEHLKQGIRRRIAGF
jgi:GxxExxY protein